MQIEIERKFLLRNGGWKPDATGNEFFRDGLIAAGEHGKVRVRISEARCSITVKTAREGLRRAEFEYKIPRGEAEALFGICGDRTIEKTRYYVPHNGITWEVDIYSGWMDGIAFAEIELQDEDQAFEAPDWLGAEVTGDPRFGKQNIVRMCGETGRCPTIPELLAMPRP